MVKILSSTSANFISVGQVYSGYSPGEDHVQSAGRRKYIAEIPIRQRNDCSRQELWRRANDRLTVLNFMSAADGSQDDEQLKDLLVKMMRIKPHVFATALEEAGICKTKMITPNDAVDIHSLLRLTDNKMRDLTLMLKNAGTHIIPSERQRKKVKVSRTTHVAKEKLEIGQMYLKRLQKDKEGTSSCPYVKVIDLIDFVQAIYDNGEMKEDPGFKNEVWLLFTGDKGGNSMKFVVAVVNDVKHGSVDNNHIFCLYQASDNLENLWKVFSPYINQVKTMQSPDFRIDEKIVKIFLGGDYHFLDAMLGHGGSSSSYPSSADFVELQHLRQHGSAKHSIEDCGIALRTVEWYQTYFRGNYLDLRREGALNENAKFHYSVIDKMLFPIKDLDNVVPAVLHIYLGITLRLFNLVEVELMKLDGVCKTVEKANRRTELATQLRQKEEEIDELESMLRENSEKIIELENVMSRFQAVASGNLTENVAIAEASYALVSPSFFAFLFAGGGWESAVRLSRCGVNGGRGFLGASA